MKSYDVIIVGGGVSGMMLAKLLDSTNLDVLLIEKRRKIEIKPNSFGTFSDVARQFCLQNYVRKYFSTWAFYGKQVVTRKSSHNFGCVVDFNAWVRSQKLKKVQFKTNTTIMSIKRIGGSVCITDNRHNKYLGNIIVDATGFAQVVRKKLKLPFTHQTGLSYEIEVRDCKVIDPSEACYILNFDISNSGGWLYGLSKRNAQYGWADFYPESHSTLKNLKRRVHTSISRLQRIAVQLDKAPIVYRFGRFGPTGDVKDRVDDNILSIGDAGSCGTPVTLQGFKQSLESASFASKTILLATKTHDYSKSTLGLYSELFDRVYRTDYRIQKIVKFVYLHWMRQEEVDAWISNFGDLSKEDFFQLLKGPFTFKLIRKTLDVSLVTNIVLNAMNQMLPRVLRFRRTITPSKQEVIDETN
ncbi:NAD(P)/FAD-dependent oxidoreductase [Candidatus Woesearchaeota archaeon]|nr:NAD(P)/FAD-dependent oxidoreductase [Candidatus Woesearchaeota archaeon]